MSWAVMSVFKELTGMLAVGLSTVWMLYLLFFKKRPEHFVLTTANEHQYQPGDFVTLNGVTYRVTDVKNSTAIVITKK